MNVEDRGRTLPFSQFKAAWRELLNALGGGTAVDRAGITRVGPALLSRYGLVHETAYPPADVLYEVEAATVAAGGAPAFLHAYADALGYVAIPKEAIDQPLQTLHDGAAPVMRDVGELLFKMGVAMRDGAVSAVEAEDMIPEARDACMETHKVLEGLKARARKGRRA
ncbi:phage regulatory CII family protein [Chelatococcus reniformis]|uniref:Uncharacterized protein n=1 Tax=Chelatococcus reniformis TaxID=1494448 RepID=A0A916UVK5_9HYPH|nr:phage regulatory CII family protein [Chelatococcus reniformis]GGC90620.1 hypothetical protein GCM10010994_55530 [Chelatococcus reniformis]